MTAREVPFSIGAERSAIGAAVLSSVALTHLVTQLKPEDFYLPKHQAIVTSLRRLYDAGIVNVDPVLVADDMHAHGTLGGIGGPSYLIELQAATPSTSAIAHYCRTVLGSATLRRLITVGTEIVETGYAFPPDIAGAVDEAKAMLANVEIPVGDGPPSLDLDEFLSSGTDEYDWLIPGLLERGDRLIVTAGEGFGKSTLLRQMAVQVAAGIHPFRLTPMTPRRVLVVDVENTPQQSRRAYRPLRELAGKHLAPGSLRIEVRTSGIDLLSRSDHQWLLQRVAVNRPDLLVIGPVYKLFNDDPNKEGPAKAVSAVLDELRGRYGTTMLIEAHSAHQSPTATKRNLRPFGASLWMRWPEFGYGLAPSSLDPMVAHVEAWRGPRDARSWPTMLRRGARAGEWPWQDEKVASNLATAPDQRPDF